MLIQPEVGNAKHIDFCAENQRITYVAQTADMLENVIENYVVFVFFVILGVWGRPGGLLEPPSKKGLKKLIREWIFGEAFLV